jgi:hypothetical protein
MLIHTQRLRLITCEQEYLAAIVRDPCSLGELLKVTVPEQWPEHPQAYSHALSLLKEQPLLPSSGWWLYLFVHPSLKALVGSGGFKSAPDADGVVEIGCEIAPAFRRLNADEGPTVGAGEGSGYEAQWRGDRPCRRQGMELAHHATSIS